MRKLLEKLVTFSLLLFVMGTFSNLFLGADLRENSVNVAQSHTGLSILELFIYLGCALFSFLYYKRMLVSLRAAWPFLLLNLYAFASTAWSIDPGTTLRRSAVLFGTTIFGIYLGGRYSLETFQKLLLQSLLVMLGASFVMLLVLPSAVLDQYHTGAFRGLTDHKNIFGEYMAILLILGLTYQFKARRRFLRSAVILLAVAMQLWARSGTSLLAITATILILPVLYLLRFKKLQMVPLIAVGGMILAYAFFFIFKASDSVLDLLGKDRTLTGRSQVWSLVWDAILRRPLLGYGYDAFWQGLKGESSRVISVVGWQVAHSHNGYLEALLGFGFVGSCIIIFAIFRVGKDSLAYVRLHRNSAGFWPFAFLAFYLIHATAEAGFIQRDGLSYLLVVILSTQLSLRRKQEKAMRTSESSCILADIRAVEVPMPALATSFDDGHRAN
jgi:exopolysaccharide production protein ExoQ